jgi:hypothetical protein
MFQVAAPPAPQTATAGVYAAPPGSSAAEFDAARTPGPIIAERRPVRRRSRTNDHGLMLAMIVLFVGIIGGLIGAGFWMHKANQARTIVASPTDVVRQKAHELVSQELDLPSGAVFAQAEERVRSLENNRWQISSHVDVPSRLASTYLRQKWVAQVSQLADGNWKLDRLEVDGQSIASRSEGPERPSVFGDRSRWLSSDNDAGGESNRFSSGPDRSTRWAVDRVTAEIRESAKLRQTLVVWLIDRSMSVRPQQQDFLRHVESALQELKKAKDAEEPALAMAVASFGSDVQFPLEKPSSEPAEVRKALESVMEDSSGRELTFAAIGQAAQKFGSFRTEKNGYVLFVVVSDEAGDDESELDQTVSLVKQQGIAVHTIGVSAPFGITVAEAQKGLEGSANVRQGPESRYAEMIKLASLGGVTVELDSGFGPFALSRLCNESGGHYLACQDYGVAAGSRYLSVSWGGKVSSKPVFDPAVLRKYAPDYVSEQEYQQILAANKACQALHDAAKLPFAEVLVNASTTFPKQDEASFKRSLDTAQRDAAKFEQRLIDLHDVLKKGESDRPKLTRPRWQAGYDLAMGRALAARVRTEGYNTMLAKIKSGGNFTKPGADTWVLQESDTIGAGSTFEKMLTQSRDYLSRVVKEHPGTPWAYLAERELAVKAGWQWTEQ